MVVLMRDLLKNKFSSFTILCIFMHSISISCRQTMLDRSAVDTAKYHDSGLLERYVDDLQSMKDSLQSNKVEEISFPVQKSENNSATFLRKGLLLTRNKALGTIIVGHGYTQSKRDVFFIRTIFPHFNVLVFDFRAHGELIDGQYSTIGQDEIFDVKGAVDFVRAHPDLCGKYLFGFGLSMGAVSLLQAQAKYGDLFDGLILDSPFDSSTDCMVDGIKKMLTINIFGRSYQLPGAALMTKGMYNAKLQPIMKRLFRLISGLNPNIAKTKFVPVVPVNIVSKIVIPTMFVTCVNDTKVHSHRVQRLYEDVGSECKWLWITPGVKHCGSCLDNPERYMYRANEFIKSVMTGTWGNVQQQIYDERATVQNPELPRV